MLQNPEVAFRDPELKRCRVEKDERNQPRPWSGAFAVVYKGINSPGQEPFAIRCFTTESPERRERYDLINDYFKSRRLQCLVDFEYRDRSIRSAGDGKWYPLILMDWVQGETLFQWARTRCLAGDSRALAACAQRWAALVKELADASIAHGDLQHANVMVTNTGELKLVDYDCMCVPALVGRRNLEVGVEPYQHPDRNERTLLSLDLDNFSALVIHVALRALAAEPQLWMKYVEGPAYDKLLFRKEDFQAPNASALYRDLINSPDPEVRELAGHLFELVHVSIDRVPPLGQFANSYAKIEQLLLARDWQAAVALLNRRGHFRDAPEQLKPLINQAYEHVCRAQAWASFQKIPRPPSEHTDRELLNAWNEALFAGFEEAERERPRVVEAHHRVDLLERLRHLIQQSAGTITLRGERIIAETAGQLPERYQHSLQFRVQQACRRVEVINRFEEALRKQDDEIALVTAWKTVVDAGFQGLVGQEGRSRVALAEQRYPLVQALREIPKNCPPDQLDGRLLDIWNEELLAGCPEAETWRPAYELAVQRRQILDKLAPAVSSGDEPEIARLMTEPCLENYPLPHAWINVVRTARQRTERTEALIAALSEGRRESILELFDARVIRHGAEWFAPYQSLLTDWTRWEVLPAEAMGLRRAVARASVLLVDKATGTYRIRWTWPQQRFTDECILAICPAEPFPDEDPRDLAVHYREPIDRQSWESGGGSRLIHTQPEWAGGHVVVWAMIDLGFCILHSEPLVLGRLEEPPKRWGLGWKGLNLFSSRPKDASTPKPDQVETPGPIREEGDPE